MGNGARRSPAAKHLPCPAPARARALGAARGEREDLRAQQHERGPEAAPAVVEPELAGVHELAQELLGDVHRHHLHHRGGASRRRRLRRQRGGAHEVQERRRRRRHFPLLVETDECMGVQDGWIGETLCVAWLQGKVACHWLPTARVGWEVLVGMGVRKREESLSPSPLLRHDYACV